MRLLISALLTALLLSGHARAQPDSPAALRQQIDRLQQQIDTLRAELNALRRSNAQLTEENKALRKALADRDTPAEKPGRSDDAPPHTPGINEARTGGPTPAITSAWLKASASPDALFVALVIDYAEHFSDSPITDEASEKARERAVLEWTKTVRTRHTSRPEWLTRITDLGRPDDRGNRPADVTILDPVTLMPNAKTFRLTFPEKFARRLAAATPRNGQDAPPLLWKMQVELEPRPVFQPGRLTPGPFDYPKFIGPFAGFGYAVRVQTLAPISLEEATRAAAEKKKALEPVDR